MCVAHPAKVIEIKDNSLVCDFLGVSEVCIGEFCPKVKVGDYVLIHGGYAIEILNEEDGEMSLEIFKELSEVVTEK